MERSVVLFIFLRESFVACFATRAAIFAFVSYSCVLSDLQDQFHHNSQWFRVSFRFGQGFVLAATYQGWRECY